MTSLPPASHHDDQAAANRRDELEAARRRRVHVGQSPPLMFAAGGPGGIGPVGECLCCGHLMRLAVWKDAPYSDVTHGVCAPCRDVALPLRGHCSTERGCLCESMGETAARRDRELREQAQRAAYALAREESRGDA